MAFDNSLTVSTGNIYERLDLGTWIKSDSTATQPIYLKIKSTVRPDGISDYLVRYERHVDSAQGAPTTNDNILSVHTVIRVDNRYFTQSNVELGFTTLKDFLTTANFTKLLRGEK